MPIDIDRFEAQRLRDAGAQIVDVMPGEEYREYHLPGAIHLPLKKLDAKAAGRLDRNRAIVVYCFDMQ